MTAVSSLNSLHAWFDLSLHAIDYVVENSAPSLSVRVLGPDYLSKKTRHAKSRSTSCVIGMPLSNFQIFPVVASQENLNGDLFAGRGAIHQAFGIILRSVLLFRRIQFKLPQQTMHLFWNNTLCGCHCAEFKRDCPRMDLTFYICIS